MRAPCCFILALTVCLSPRGTRGAAVVDPNLADGVADNSEGDLLAEQSQMCGAPISASSPT